MAGKARDRRRAKHKRSKMNEIRNPRISIEMDVTTGQVSYNGPADMLVFFGLLEFVKADLIRKSAAADSKPQPKVVVPSIVPPRL